MNGTSLIDKYLQMGWLGDQRVQLSAGCQSKFNSMEYMG